MILLSSKKLSMYDLLVDLLLAGKHDHLVGLEYICFQEYGSLYKACSF